MPNPAQRTAPPQPPQPQPQSRTATAPLIEVLFSGMTEAQWLAFWRWYGDLA